MLIYFTNIMYLFQLYLYYCVCVYIRVLRAIWYKYCAAFETTSTDRMPNNSITTKLSHSTFIWSQSSISKFIVLTIYLPQISPLKGKNPRKSQLYLRLPPPWIILMFQGDDITDFRKHIFRGSCFSVHFKLIFVWSIVFSFIFFCAWTCSISPTIFLKVLEKNLSTELILHLCKKY